MHLLIINYLYFQYKKLSKKTPKTLADSKISSTFASQLRNKPTQRIVDRVSKANGQIPEWPNGADCKSAVFRLRWFESIFAHKNCGSSSVDRALAFQAEGRGFEPRLPLLVKSDSYRKILSDFSLKISLLARANTRVAKWGRL